jgi:pyridoxamine 5'-phosphate oxidase
MALADLRKEYTLAGLRRADLDANPVTQFKKWFDQACGLYSRPDADASAGDVNAATLATADKQGRPSARIVLLKGVDERGFIFFTNYNSRKGRELSENPEAALAVYWPGMERQVCIAGQVSRLPKVESEAYFKSRPRGSRLAAWASHQSEAVENRAVLEKRWQELDGNYPGESVPMPPYWGGFVVSPARIEFWQGRPSRLHDRFCYDRQVDGTWRLQRLAP